MAVGAYAAYNFQSRIGGIPLIPALLLGGLCHGVGVLFGIPSLRVRGLYLAVATLAAQFFVDWAFLRIKWFTNDSPPGRSIGVQPAGVGLAIDTPGEVSVLPEHPRASFGAAGGTWCAAIGANGWPSATWTSPPRDRHPPGLPKLGALRSVLFIVGVAGALGLRASGRLGTRRPSTSTARSAAVHGHHRRAGQRSWAASSAPRSSWCCRSRWTRPLAGAWSGMESRPRPRGALHDLRRADRGSS